MTSVTITEAQRRALTKAQAEAVADIVAEECGAVWSWDSRTPFVHYMTKPNIAHEWRLNSALGFGGKVYRNANRGGRPYVSCYREDETPVGIAMMERANKRLADLLANAEPET